MLLRRFWIISGCEVIKKCTNHCTQEVIKKCTNHCMISKKNKAAPVSQLMALLPQIRLKLNIRALSNVGHFFAGPFLTIHGRGKA